MQAVLATHHQGLTGVASCADNALVALPESICSCTSLVKLQASFNKLSALPAGLGSLPKLELLRVACNCLQEVLLASDASCIGGLARKRSMWNSTCPGPLSVLKSCAWLRSSRNRRCMHVLAPMLGQHALSSRCASAQVPEELSGGQSLAWVSLAGNPCCASAPPHRREIMAISVDALGMGAALGGGASGDVFAATMACSPT